MPLKYPYKLNVVLVAAGMMLASPAAFAYLDPSTSGMIISAIVGLFASAALAIKTYWYRIKAFFRSDEASGDAKTARDPGASLANAGDEGKDGSK